MKTDADWAGQAACLADRVREKCPLVHNITNYVVMNFTANLLLAAGASPVMAHAEGEIEEMVSLAQALVLNLGTLDEVWLAAMLQAGNKAAEIRIPVVLDPVGAGATSLRTTAARRILDEVGVSLVRANASEILALGGNGGGAHTRGVDAAHGTDEAAASAVALARERGVAVAMTGAVDLITDGQRVVRVANGHPLMSLVTGTGCGASALAGAYAGVADSPLEAAAAALAVYGRAGERAAAAADGPGSFAVRFLDALHGATGEDIRTQARIHEG